MKRRVVKFGGVPAMIAVAAALALAGCGDTLGLVGPRISVSLGVERVLPGTPWLHADIGGQRVEVAPNSPGAPRAERELRGPRYGTVPVKVALVTAAGDTMAKVEFNQDFTRDHNHWVSGQVGQQRPEGHCIGTVVATPLRNTPADSLFVMYGAIPQGAIC